MDCDRPNTVLRLNAKRKELVKLLWQITAEVEKVWASIKSIDACVILLDPNAKPLATERSAFTACKPYGLAQFVQQNESGFIVLSG